MNVATVRYFADASDSQKIRDNNSTEYTEESFKIRLSISDLKRWMLTVTVIKFSKARWYLENNVFLGCYSIGSVHLHPDARDIRQCLKSYAFCPKTIRAQE